MSATESRAQEHVQNGLLVAAALEVAKDNATRSPSFWGRLGGFVVTVIAATIGSAAVDAVINAFKSRRRQAEVSEINDAQATAPTPEAAAMLLAQEKQRASWAQDISAESKKPDCGCPYRH